MTLGTPWNHLHWIGKLSDSMEGATSNYARNRRTRGKETINPSSIFFEKLKNHSQWEMLKGYSDWVLKLNPHAIKRDEPMYLKQKVRHQNQDCDSDFYLFTDKEIEGGGAILESPSEHSQSARVVLKCLWVPEEFSRKGIARRALETLIKMCDEVDALAVAKEEWKEQYIGGNHCCLSLVPNPFIVDWSLDKEFLQSVDWSDSEKATCDYNMVDECHKELRKDQQRVPWKKLKEFYESLGFEDCEALGFHTYYDETVNRILKRKTMMGRSYAIGRMVMLYPSRYLKIYEENELE